MCDNANTKKTVSFVVVGSMKSSTSPPLRHAWFFVRITVAKIVKSERMEQTLRGVPIVQNDPNWTCRIWVRDALASLAADKGVLGTSVTLWPTVEDTTKQYVRRKKDQHRFDGQAQWDMEKVPTWDLIDDKETVP